MAWSRVPALTFVSLLVIGLMVPLSSAASELGQAFLVERQSRRPLCPDLTIAVHPSQIHFTPGLVEHQSWLEFAVPRGSADHYELCFDGRQIAAGRRLEYSSRGTARLSVHTRLIDLNWLAHTLDGFVDPSRWELRLAAGSNP